MNELKVGDIVQLKSGGPKMTIQGINKESVECSWFVNKEHKSDFFNYDTLALYSQKPAIVGVVRSRKIIGRGF